MNRARAVGDIRSLEAAVGARQQASLSYDLTKSPVVTLGQFQFPRGWENTNGSRRGDVLFNLHETYPRTQPDVYISAGMRFRGEVPHTMYHTVEAGGRRWTKYCIHHVRWNPSRHNLVKMLDILEISLESPHSNNPLHD
ncbi:E2/UBC family protein [Salinigranum marinum]|uniref:E2/UBC family protein n=1 Tax=Salinigranum marinum TaxID=1515595 RepID=UPI002989DED7|nr:E2/UBC family protein [Salinigranum marinum]